MTRFRGSAAGLRPPPWLVTTCSSNATPRLKGGRTRSSDRAARRGSIAEHQTTHNPRAAPELSVVIPALDEARRIAATIEHVRRLSPAIDVVVVDGGSRDGTADAARAAGARVTTTPPGRGTQMNAGARLARGAAFLFLHADCRLPLDALAAIAAVFASGHEAGIFSIRYDSRHPMLRLAGALSRFEGRCTSFGEGALFVRRDTFEALGGFVDWPLFEDVELLGRLRVRQPIGRAAGAVLASARRYEKHGVLRQQLRNAVLFALYSAGVSPHRLAGSYTATAR